MNRDPDQQEDAQEQEEIRKRCNSYLGPFQPGVTAPDPTDPDGGFFNDPQDPSKAKRTKATRPYRRGERRSAGQPRALPLPGQTDPSVPEIVLPPAVQDLVDRLRRDGRLPEGNRLPENLEQLPGLPRGVAPDQMLDFLLAP
jgi:hypothetical protein